MLSTLDIDLLTLRIMIAPRRDSGTEVLFQVAGGDIDPLDVVRCSLAELGMPVTLEGMQPVRDHQFRIPGRVVSKVGNALDQFRFRPDVRIPNGTEVWLEFPNPRGSLYIMPWERLLRPLGRQLLRLPYHAVRPPAPGEILSVAICATTPMAKSRFDVATVLERLIERYAEATVRTVIVHVFTDLESQALVTERLDPAGHFAIVHNPASNDCYKPPPRSTRIGASAELSSPWLLWMRDAMQGQPLHVVHFVSHGYMSGDQGAIAMAASPTNNSDPSLWRLIGAFSI